MQHTSQLSLLVPWELPIDGELSSSYQIKLTKALAELLQALADSDVQQSIVTLEKLIADLEVYEVFTPEEISTNTTLKYWEVEDFDTYFDVRHVQSHEPEICLIQGLLVTCQRFLYLSQLDSTFIDINQLELQRDGFKSYIQLIARVFT
ncbi:MAG: hypothetical protein HC903_07390 [Methylacidiphilales bacterium]|nr:hypothetical protein [Candidatus Methylacidiphilales bacterium]